MKFKSHIRGGHPELARDVWRRRRTMCGRRVTVHTLVTIGVPSCALCRRWYDLVRRKDADAR